MDAQAIAGQATSKPDVAVDTHRQAVKLVEMSVGRDKLAALLPDLIAQQKGTFEKLCPKCDPAFFDELVKRMIARVKVDDFLDVAARGYEKHFTNKELTELVDFVNAKKIGKPVPLSPALQKKVIDLQPVLMGEIVGGCTEIGARLGGQIGAEIQKEHPEYLKPKSAKP